MRVCVPIVLAASIAMAQTAPSLESGRLPESWLTGGPRCVEIPEWQVHEYNPTVLILRQSGCVNYEKPFLYLFIGRDRALLIDTGAEKSTAASFVTALLPRWAAQNKRTAPVLFVAHTHGHGDHVAGDAGFMALPDVTLVPATVEANQKAFGIANWPEGAGSIDLGDRVIEVIPIPGHHQAHVAYYDRKTGILHTGDHLYPGRLYVTDFPAYVASTRRLVEFTATRPVSHVVGCHIEQSATPFVDYPVGTVYQPEEHTFALGRAHLLELLAALEALNGKPARVFLRDFTIWPREPRPAIKK
jgi:glyoxylase-like metal-dependent hydrolase (beta-lactamase superfamily II)